MGMCITVGKINAKDVMGEVREPEPDEKVCKFYLQNLSNLKIYYDLMDNGYDIDEIAKIMNIFGIRWK